jgi:exosortase/archaeosortase family protein
MAQTWSMSPQHLSPLVRLRQWLRHGQQRWQEAPPTVRVGVQLGVLLVAVVVAYNYSLITLMQNVGLETPLAYVSLVPAIALGLAAVRSKPNRPEPAIHDRQVDYIVGLPLVAGAVAVNLTMPHKLSVMFWVWRLDLLSMPFFVAGAIALIFGTRVLWRQRLAIAYLILAWPLPWSAWLLGVLNAFTNVTLAALHAIVKVIHVATVLPGDGSIFSVVHHGSSFPLSVVSACSGVNGVVGFLLVGVAFGFIVKGPKLRKGLWLLGGIVLIWMMNLVRLIFIFWAGNEWGEHVAISILHPFVGLVTFGIGVVVMMVFIRPFGLTLLPPPLPSSPPGPAPAEARKPALAVPKIFAAVMLIVAAAAVLGVADYHLRTYNLVANSAGEPTLTAMTGLGSRLAAPHGWSGSYEAQYTWATPYFGDTSTWFRYVYEASPDAEPYSSLPVTVDVINTTDLNSFSAYGIIACYQFHGFQLKDVADVDLGGGITGQTLSYTAGNQGNWSIVYWIVPVKNGTTTHYERVVAYLVNTTAGVVRVPKGTPEAQNLSGELSQLSPQDRILMRNRAFLVAFAKALIDNQAKGGSLLSASSRTPAKTA